MMIKARPDLTNYVIHWTKSYKVLREILKCGYFKPSRGLRPLVGKPGKPEETIRGPFPAVCFTEQPLDCFVISCRDLPKNYKPYGVALNKRYLYYYGGRPVIYGDCELLHSLPADYEYLYVRYDNWTHEREWRCRAKRYCEDITVEYSFCLEGVPILLPMDCRENYYCGNPPDFWILVGTKKEATDLKRWISSLSYEGEYEYLSLYLEVLPNAQVISLQEVKEHLQSGEQEWARIDTLQSILGG